MPTPALWLIPAILSILPSPGQAAGPPTPGTLTVTPVDVLDRVFPDCPPVAAPDDLPVSVPRGGTVSFQFALVSTTDVTCTLSAPAPVAQAGGPGAGSTDVYELVAVPVEANTNGGSRSGVGRVPPESWLQAFVRQAPFEVAEVLSPATQIGLRSGVTAAVLVDVHVQADAPPGVYASYLEATAGERSVRAPLHMRVHETRVGDQMALHSTHWLFPEPENLTNGERPGWWSDRHWELVANSARALRRFGQDTILTPLVDYEHALIQVTREADGSYGFDYSRFDRWVELFLGLGFRRIAGHHISMLPDRWIYEGVFVTDRATGRKSRLVEAGRGAPDWLAFVPIFYDSLHKHLSERGWTDLYLQHQLDEPKDEALYATLAGLARTHMPGVRTIDAINSRPEAYSPLVDVQVFALTVLSGNAALAAQRREARQGVWLYHCCSPYPPYPNRHLDERLSDSRLYPWLAYLLGADGYLYWGANVYRGADPYRTSVGPVPNGSQDPGHPPGDNWLFYPGPDGLLGSMRMVAFREGLLDHTLLTMLAQRDQVKADQVMARIARSIKDYEKGAPAFHAARRELLTGLDAA